MSLGPTLKDILGRLTDEAGKRKPSAAKSRQSLDARERYSLASFEHKLEDILERHDVDLSNHVYLLDLTDLRERVGEQLDLDDQRVQATIRNTLERRTGENDLYIQYDDFSYLLIFPVLSAAEGQLKSRIIGEEIVRALLGDNKNTTSFKLKVASSQQGNGLEFTDTPPVDNLFDNLHAELNAVTAMKRTDSKSTPNILDEVDFIFKPMLAINSKIVSTFLCMPVRPISEGYRSGYGCLPISANESQIFDLDVLTLNKGAEALENLFKSDKKSLIAMPIHFETLAKRTRRIQYMELFTKHFGNRERRIIFEVCGLPDGIPQSRLTELVAELHNNARSVLTRVAMDHKVFKGYHESNVHAVGIDVYTHAGSERDIMEKICAFLKAAKQYRLKTYIIGIDTISLYSAAIAEGFDYIAGYALANSVASAEDIYKFELETPYAQLLDRLRGPKDS